jgi:mRNA interferase HigB
MRILSFGKLRDFWTLPGRGDSESSLRGWFQATENADWDSPPAVRRTFNTADFVGNKGVFDIAGNNYRLIAVVDYPTRRVFVRHVLTHAEYDSDEWKKDDFGTRLKKKVPRPKPGQQEQGSKPPRRPRGKKR